MTAVKRHDRFAHCERSACPPRLFFNEGGKQSQDYNALNSQRNPANGVKFRSPIQNPVRYSILIKKFFLITLFNIL
jgi:hypothetical protein